MSLSVVISSDRIPESVAKQTAADLIKALEDPFIATQVRNKNINNLVPLVKSAFVASRKERVGAAPSKLALDKMEEVIKYYASRVLPIPVHTVAVQCKIPPTKDIDLAEVFFLKSLQALQDRVKAVYPPGIVVIVRLEDNTLTVLRGDSQELRNHLATSYDKLCLIKEVLGYDFITLIRESDIVPMDQFITEALNVVQIFLRYLQESTGKEEDMALDSLKQLHAVGYRGYCSIAQRQYMMERLPHCFSELDPSKYNENIARYMSSVMIRNKAGASAVNKEWTGGCVMITYTHPNPDATQVVGGDRLQYRYVPSVSHHTIPFWRGTLMAEVKLAGGIPMGVSFHARLLTNPELNEAEQVSVILERGDKKVELGLSVLIKRLAQQSMLPAY